MSKFTDDLHHIYMKMAVNEAKAGIDNRHGGPFGAVIVNRKTGKAVGFGHNQVLRTKDPTMHGEISAIRYTCNSLNTHDLSGHVLYTTGEPCLMCLAACKWANIDKVYYACSVKDTTDMLGFQDDGLDEWLGVTRDKEYCEQVCRQDGIDLFNYYNSIEHELY